MGLFNKQRPVENVPQKPVRAAIVYDYDGTLAKGNIQEDSFLPSIQSTPQEFWSQVKAEKEAKDADEILVYMRLMLRLAKAANVPVTKASLRAHGGTSQLFAGLQGDNDWFSRMNEYAAKQGLQLEHYIISSGNQEMIEGSPIADEFKEIFACRFEFDAEGQAVGPNLAINYTTKTQFLFRINKGILNAWDNEGVNAFVAETDRPVPFSRMIFIGDGDTDIPAMKMTSHNGGYAIAAYPPEANRRSLNKIHRLITDERANFISAADYSENSDMDIQVKGIIGRMARSAGLKLVRDDA